MAEIKFTDSQDKVISHKNNNLLVFASAGSGKTAVIIEKIAQDIISGQASLDSLLIVTFTEAATAEMKQRLYSKLASNIDKPNVIAEIEKLPLANISTLHGYCQKLIKQYFFELGIDPSFRILDETESEYYKIKMLDDIFDARQEEKDKDFLDLCEKFYSSRNLNNLKKSILDFYDFLQALDDKEKYLNDIALCSYNTDLDNNPAIKYAFEKFSNSYVYFKKSFENLCTASDIEGNEKLSKALSTINSYLGVQKFKNFEALFNYFSSLKEVKSPLSSLRGDSDVLLDARNTWKNFLKFRDSFYDACGGDDQTLSSIKEALNLAGNSLRCFIDITKEFEKSYSSEKLRLNALDFDDLEKYAILLLDRKEIADEIKKQFSNIYVDEYQDINSKQEKILSLITSGKNMIMVGDIKQSIYGFRNSSPQIFIDKSKLYKDGKKGDLIKLNENFRSNPIILDFVNKIFVNVMKDDFGGVDYASDGFFVGSAKYEKVDDYKEVSLNIIDVKDRKPQEKVESKLYSVKDDNREAQNKEVAKLEATLIANKIKAMRGKPYYDAKEKCFKTLDYRNFNVLCRSREYIKNIASHLRELGVPTTAKTSSNIYENPDVLLLVNILKLVNNPLDDIALASVLSCPFFGITFDELARCDFSQKYFYEYINSERKKDTEFAKKLNKVFDFIETLREKKDFLSIYELLTEIDNILGITSYYLLLPNGRNRCEVITNFIESFNGTPYNNSLTKYLSYLENYLEDTEVPELLQSDENAISIDTIHSSKGLEYEVVFLCGMGKKFSNISLMQNVLKNKELGIGFNAIDLDSYTARDTIAKNVIAMKVREEEKLEEIRLLYVATTRAKNSLNIIACVDKDKLEKPSEFDIKGANKYITWVLSALPRPLIENIKNCDSKKTFNEEGYEVNVVFPENLEISLDNSNIEKSQIQKDKNLTKEIEEYIDKKYAYTESTTIAEKNTVTGIMNALDSYESYNLEPKKLKLAESSAVDFDYALLGTIYHKLMQDLDFDASESQIIDYIKTQKEQNIDTAKYYDKISPSGIKACFDTLLPLTFGKNVYKERQFISYLPYSAITGVNAEDKVLLQGVIDLLVEDDEGVDIYDYKTTKVSKPDQLVEKYSVQMKLYKLATERAIGKKVKNVYIYSFCLNKLIKII